MSRKSEVASRKYKRSRALLVCPACGKDFMVLQDDSDVRPQPVVPARGPAADTLAGAARGNGGNE